MCIQYNEVSWFMTLAGVSQRTFDDLSIAFTTSIPWTIQYRCHDPDHAPTSYD
jgi:hypothetical protein